MIETTTIPKTLDFYTMIEMGIEYFDFQDVSNGEKTGTRYILDKPLSTLQRAKLQEYSNVIISSCSYKYAPEITYDTIIVLDD
jgi:hypothetical protein